MTDAVTVLLGLFFLAWIALLVEEEATRVMKARRVLETLKHRAEYVSAISRGRGTASR